MLYDFLRLLSALIFKTFFCFQVKGAKNIPKKGGFILASNHASYLDPVALGAACPRRLNFMARDDLFNIPLFGRLIAAVGAFPVKREAGDLRALKEAMRRVKDDKALALFPEGRREFAAAGFALLAPRPGIGFLVAKLNVPVIPAFIKGTANALPRGAKFIRAGKIVVYFGQPRFFSGAERLLNEKGRDKEIYIERGTPYQDIAQRIIEDIRRLSCQALN